MVSDFDLMQIQQGGTLKYKDGTTLLMVTEVRVGDGNGYDTAFNDIVTGIVGSPLFSTTWVSPRY